MPGGRSFGFGQDGRDGRGFGFRFGDGEFNFEGMQEFFDGIEGFEGVIPPEGAFSIACQNSDGDTVFSFEFSGSDGFDIENFELPNMDGGFDFENLDCQVNNDGAPDAAPDASTNGGDL
jgi:hypothetical protein